MFFRRYPWSKVFSKPAFPLDWPVTAQSVRAVGYLENEQLGGIYVELRATSNKLLVATGASRSLLAAVVRSSSRTRSDARTDLLQHAELI
jgi:hypothetical protein